MLLHLPACEGGDDLDQSQESLIQTRGVKPGAPCVTGDDCARGQACFGDPGECLCAPGLAMCGDECLDLATDRRNCGACGRACPRARACIEAVCEGEGDEGIAAASIDVADLISPGDPLHECTQEQFDGFNEAYPERSINGDTNNLWAAFNRFKHGGPQGGDGEFYNVSDNNVDPGWGLPPPLREVPVLGNLYTEGDPWATTSGLGWEYTSFIVHETAATNRRCIGIGAAVVSQLQSGNWARSVQCANTLDDDYDDGPAIHYDLGAPRLWAVALEIPQNPPPGYNICGPNTGSDPGVCLYLFSPCNGAQPWPNTAGCPLAFQKKVMTDITGHATVIASPVTHNAIVVYRTLEGIVQMKIFNAQGNQIGATHPIRTTATYGQPSECASGCGLPTEGSVPKCGGCLPDCGLFDNCARLVSKPHLAVKHDLATGRVYLYVAFDELCNSVGPDGQTHMKGRVEIVEITNETAPVLRGGFSSSDCATDGGNDFASTVSMTANTYSGGDTRLGFFYYRQPSVLGFPDTCNTIYTGKWGAGYTPAALADIGTLGGPFPTMTFATARGMGDYSAAVRRGTTAGWFYPTWAQPVRIAQDAVSCEECLGHEYSLAIYGRRVKP